VDDTANGGLDTSSIDGIIGYRLRRAQLSVFGRFLKRFATVELKPAEYSLLVIVADNPGQRPSQVAAALGIKRANFVALAARLETRGLIERQQAVADRRSHALAVTRAGKTMVTRIRRLQQGFEAELIVLLGGEAERDRLIALLKKLG
jgi:DNA-binding MarR family transcriptional regulator